MSGLQPFAEQGRVPALSRHSREVSRIIGATDLAVVRVAAGAQVDTARLDAVDMVAMRAMQGVGLVSQLEQQLAQVVPIAASRLQAIGDMHAYASVNVVASMARGR